MTEKENLHLRINAEILKCKNCFNIDEYYINDYLHDAFIVIVEKLDKKYVEMGKLEAWVHTVAVNYIRTRLKQDNRYQFCSFDEINEKDIIRENSSNREIKKKVAIEMAVSALEELPEFDNKIVRRRMNNCSCCSLAKDLKVNVKTIRKHLFKSCKHIANKVSDSYYKRFNEEFEYNRLL